MARECHGRHDGECSCTSSRCLCVQICRARALPSGHDQRTHRNEPGRFQDFLTDEPHTPREDWPRRASLAVPKSLCLLLLLAIEIGNIDFDILRMLEVCLGACASPRDLLLTVASLVRESVGGARVCVCVRQELGRNTDRASSGRDGNFPSLARYVGPCSLHHASGSGRSAWPGTDMACHDASWLRTLKPCSGPLAGSHFSASPVEQGASLHSTSFASFSADGFSGSFLSVVCFPGLSLLSLLTDPTIA